MRQLLRYISVLMMLFVGTIASAQSTIQVMTVTNGTVSVDKASATKGELVTITVTPSEGYYFQKENLEVVKTVNPASTRGDIPIADPIAVSGSDPADLSVARSYTFTVPDNGYVLQVSATFTARTAITDGMVSLSATSFTYNGSDQKPTVSVTGLTEGTDYTVSFAESAWKNVGTYSVSVSGKSTYKGTVTKTFTISAADGSLTPPTGKSDLVYTGAAQDLITAGSSTTGTMQYSLDGTNYSTEIPQGTDAKEYTVYYKVVANAGYSDVAPASFKVTIAAKTVSSPTITLSETSYTYDGNAKEPTVTVKDGGTTIPATEYSVSYTNNTNVGTATVTITDVEGGNYAVSGSTTFAISAADGSLTPPTGKSDLVYTGAAQDLITAGSSTTGTMQYSLDGTNYSTKIPQGTDAKEYTVYYKVVANAGYSDVAPASFKVTIAAKTVSSPTITLSETSYVYDGQSKEPTVTVKDGEMIIPSSEYTVSYSNNTNAGTATVTITDKAGGNYTVSGSATFEIKSKDEPAIVNIEDPVTVDGQTYYEPTEEVQEAINESIGTDIGLPEEAKDRVEVTDAGGLKFSKGEDISMALLDLKLNDIVKFVFTGSLYGNSKKLRLKNAASRGTRTAGDIELISDVEYEVIEAGDQTVTVKLEEEETIVEAITVTEPEKASITIGGTGKATYTGKKSLDFSFSDEIKAYVATGIDKESGTIWLTRVKDVPAGVPVMIKGVSSKTYNVPVKESKDSYYENMFVGNTSGESITINETSDDGTMTNYYMSGGQFVSVKGNAKIGDGKCYLQLPTTLPAVAPGANQPVKIAATGKSSYAAPVDLDFTNVEGLKAFTATGYDRSSKTIWLTRVMKAQKGEGLLLKGDANQTYSIPSSGVQSGYGNMFVGNTSGESITIYETNDDGSLTNFYLTGGQFKSVTNYATIGNNKCYLQLPTEMVAAAASTRGAEANYIFEEPEVISMPIVIKGLTDADGTTGIDEIIKYERQSDDAFYNLQGQRVDNPGKGLYIRNGKKVVVKNY